MPDRASATATLWDAPTASGPVRATVRVPGSKSVTNRALVIAALAEEPTRLRGALVARDTLLMAAALQALGAQVDPSPSAPGLTGTGDVPDVWTVVPGPLRAPADVDCGLAGTVMRFVPPVAALADGPVRLDGDAAARERPMAPLLGALRDLGVRVEAEGDRLPLTVHGTGAVRGGVVAVDASASSQFASGLLLAGCRYEQGLRVVDAGPRLPSRPHVDMTLAMLAARGVQVHADDDGRAWQVAPGRPGGGEVALEADVSNALPFAAAALVTGGRVVVEGFPSRDGVQPVAQAIALLEAFGARVSGGGREPLQVDGSGGLVAPGELDLSETGELVPVAAALAALAPGTTTIAGVAHLRGHETDRLAALASELAALGADVAQTADGLVVRPARLHGGVFETYADHRLATAAAVLGLAVPGVRVVDVATTGKTLPGFVERWLGMLAA